MKLRHIAAAAALAAIAGQAAALTPTQAAAATTIYFSGASATKAAFGGLFTQNCQASTRNDYTLASDSTFGTIYTCTLNTTNDFGLGAINVMFQKRDAGGSGMGVYPVANSTGIAFINIATCATPVGTASATCTGQTTVVPDGGTSDVEPAMFEAALNTPAGFTGAVNTASITVDPYVSTVFGLAVSNALYTKLQADQGLAASVRPSVSQAAVGMMLRSGFPYDSQAWKILLPNTVDGTQNSQVTICRRVNGSGTQASANRFFLEYPSNSGVTMAPYTHADSTDYNPSSVTDPVNHDVTHGTTAGKLAVFEGSSTGNVTACLTSANTAGGFAIGHVSLENGETATWKFVKINGQEPSRDNAKTGKYPYFFESTCQYRNSLTGNDKTFAQKLCEGSSNPTNLGSLGTATQNGVFTPPQNGVCRDGVAAGVETTFCGSVTRNGNSAEFPSFY